MTTDESNPLEFNPIALQALVHLGRRQGLVTRSDILDLVPDAEFDPPLFQQVLDQLAAEGVRYSEEDDPTKSPVEQFNEVAEALEEVVEEELEPGEDVFAGVEADNMIRMYIKEAVRSPLLTAEQEVELARLVEACRLAQEELSENPPPSRREELLATIERGQHARDRLVQSNTRLVISIAKRYRDRGLPLLDLIQEGNIGLMRAIRNFDYKRGFRFSTYATWWIRQAITRALADQSRAIRIPAYLSDQISALSREQHRLQQTLNRPPTPAELSKALNLPLDKIDQLLEISRQPVSLQSPVGEESDEELGDILQDRSSPNPEESAIQSLASADIRSQLDTLPARERQLLEMRYGLTGEEPMTLADVGQRMGISRERARQLEVQALNRLRHSNTTKKKHEE